MKFFVLFFTLSLILIANGYTEIKQLFGDLDNDGLKEKVTWKKFVTTEIGDYYQLVVYNDDGSILWKGPKTTDENSPYLVASLDYGVSTPEALVDIDKDGKLELLIPAIQSDVSPLWYKRLKWNGYKFIPMKEAILKYNPYSRTTPLKWIYKYPPNYSFWVMSLSNYKSNLLKASIVGLYPNGKNDYGEAIIKPVKKGAKIIRWIKPLKGPGSNYSIISYIATLGKRDHFNSKGKKLNRLIDVIIQDRANFYKGIRDLKDQSDPIFMDKEFRDDLKNYSIIVLGSTYNTLRRVILNKTPTVKIWVDKNIGVIKIKVLKKGISSSNIEFSYIAKISSKDHFNSRGVRLKNIKAILQQDRANFHKGRADSLDTYDRYFKTRTQRAKIRYYKIVPIRTSYRYLRNEIIKKTPLIGVRVSNHKLAIKIIKP